MNGLLLLTARQRLRATLWLLVAGFLAAFALAPGLWLSGSPLVPLPVIPGLAGLPRPLDVALLVLLAISLPIAALLPRPKRWLIAWMALFLLRASWDVALWQPYFIEYLGIMALVVFVRDEERALGLARLILCAGYLWPGIAKIDHRFVSEVAPGTLAPVLQDLGLVAPAWLGATIPAAEIAVAVLLFSRRFRLAGVALALATHGVILWAIGPCGHDIQQIVWPWNFVLPGLVVVLFGVGTGTGRWPSWRDVFRVRDRWLALVVFFFAALPALSYVVPVDPYVALRVYSTKIHEGVLLLSEEAIDALPARSRKAIRARAIPAVERDRADRLAIRIENWSEEELGGYLSPSAATHRAVARRVCRLAPDGDGDGDDVTLMLVEPTNWRTGEAERSWLRCDQLR